MFKMSHSPHHSDDERRSLENDLLQETIGQPASPKGGPLAGEEEAASSEQQTLYVSGLSREMVDDNLRALFTPFGTLSRAQVVMDPHTRENRGFGFISYDNESSVVAAIAALDKTQHNGRMLGVERARRGKARSPTPGKYFGPGSVRQKHGGRDSYHGRGNGGGDRGGRDNSGGGDRPRRRYRSRSRSRPRNRSRSRDRRDYRSSSSGRDGDRYPDRYAPPSRLSGAYQGAPPSNYERDYRSYDRLPTSSSSHQMPPPPPQQQGYYVPPVRDSYMAPPPPTGSRYDAYAPPAPVYMPPPPMEYERRYPPPMNNLPPMGQQQQHRMRSPYHR